MADPTITYHDFPDALGEPVYAFKVHCRSHAEREARVARIKGMPVAAAYTPGLCAGEAFDAPEYVLGPPPGVELRRWTDEETAALCAPPPCDGLYPDGYSAGLHIAQAQHTLAEQPDDACTAVGCAVPIPDEH